MGCRTVLLLITVLAVASVSVRAEGLDAEIESKFVPAAQATAKAAELGKPLMVLITESWYAPSSTSSLHATSTRCC